jgi:hypothetical protein
MHQKKSIPKTPQSPEKLFFGSNFLLVNLSSNTLSDLKSAKNSGFFYTHIDLCGEKSFTFWHKNKKSHNPKAKNEGKIFYYFT